MAYFLSVTKAECFMLTCVLIMCLAPNVLRSPYKTVDLLNHNECLFFCFPCWKKSSYCWMKCAVLSVPALTLMVLDGLSWVRSFIDFCLEVVLYIWKSFKSPVDVNQQALKLKQMFLFLMPLHCNSVFWTLAQHWINYTYTVLLRLTCL